MNILLSKLKEVMHSVLPIFFIVIILNFTIVSVDFPDLMKFIIGTFLIIIGLSIFLFGVDIGITPIGQLIGVALAKTNKIVIIIIAGLIVGFFISMAEPSLNIVAENLEVVSLGAITQRSIVVSVSIGLAIMLTFGLVRILYGFSLKLILSLFYFIVLIFGIFTPPEFLVISFDMAGATTGAMAVPFILALSVGISGLKKNTLESKEDSFGLIGITSIGPILAVMIMSMMSNTAGISSDSIENTVSSNSILSAFYSKIPSVSLDVVYALLPLLITFLFFQKIYLNLERKPFLKIIKGMIYAFIGLVLFMLGVNQGFMEVGSIIGFSIASKGSIYLTIFIAFTLGFVSVLAEPAVHFLTKQVENVTSGAIRKNPILLSLAIGIGVAVAISIVRVVVPSVQFWHFLLPGYIFSLILSYKVPKFFIGMSFDAGGVASGPMTATFILAFVQGVAKATEGADVVLDGFGMISMVAMTPIIALQILGLVYKAKTS
ncbi:MAG: DUF1538 domain-containing protein [Candidatus Muirbacterium halophilum]|nr:DUF1538 domain-containing protein [Candidatus Muirbacterium halophilum]MCK9474854.1 DUF1538 domain-containing protein [Candidatus Muirbacterium halophilum]